MTGENAKFGEWLRGLRMLAGLSQDELSERSGVSVRTIGDLERGRARVPYRGTLGRLADALGLSGPARTEFLGAPGRRLGPRGDVPATASAGGPPSGREKWHSPAPGRTPELPVPRELPGAVANFTGRTSELAALNGLLLGAGEQSSGAVVISAIGGTAGVGKTALAVHWAHRVCGRFPDGQLYVNLRGYDPGQPVSAADALAGLLRSLGVPGQAIPPEEDERAARFRSMLAGKRILIVLDNAGSADQVRPLLPGNPACAVVVTSRDALPGLVVKDGATRLDLDVLPLQDSVALLGTLIGARVDAEPGPAADLADQCCRLPLALRVTAELAASRPAVPLAELAAELADLRARLDLLTAGGDQSTDVRTVFSWSYRHLDDGTARTFRLLGLHPGPDIENYAVAALTGATVAQARKTLAVLARAHLIQPTGASRYDMHDLLRGYARELSVALDTSQEQSAALTSLFDAYLYIAAAAMDLLHPAEHDRRPRIPRTVTPVPPLPDARAAREWLDYERATLVAVAGHAATHGWPCHVTKLAGTVALYLIIGRHLAEATAVFSHALDAAQRSGDRVAEARALNLLGTVVGEEGHYHQAATRHRQAVALFRAAGDKEGVARALGNLGTDEVELGRYEQAARHQGESLALFRELGDRLGEARKLGHLGVVRQLQGRYQAAAGHLLQALDVFRELGDCDGEAWMLIRLGVVDLRQSRYELAAGYLRDALALVHERGIVQAEAECLIRLGEVDLGTGRYQDATGKFEQALPVFRELDDPVLEADTLNGLGEAAFRTGEAAQALMHHASALQLASQADVLLQTARAHHGLARAFQAAGDSDQAQHHICEALTRYTAIGAPQAGEIRALLASHEDGSDGLRPDDSTCFPGAPR